MESNFDQTNHAMRGDNMQPLPPELDWDNMRDGILDKMQSMEQAKESQRRKVYPWWKVGLVLALLFTLSFSLFWVTQKLTEGHNTDTQDVASMAEPNKQVISSSATEKPALTQDFGPVSDSLEETIRIYKDQSQAPKDIQTHGLSNTLGNHGRVAASQYAQNGLSTSTETSPASLMNPVPKLQFLTIDIFDQHSLKRQNQLVLDLPPVDHGFPDYSQSAKFPDKFILEGGITFWNEGYGSTRPERPEYEMPLASFQLQGHYIKNFNRNHFVMLGLQYQQLESRFEYNTTIQDHTIVLKDTIIRIENNLLTGEQIVIRGDVEQTVQAERQVRHHNTTRLFKLSAGLGKTWRFNSFQTDIYLGGAMNAISQNQGRTLYNDAVIDYNGPSNVLFQNQFRLDGMLGARLHYYLNHRVGLTTGIQVQKSLMNWSRQADITMNPGSLSVQMGLSYSLW